MAREPALAKEGFWAGLVLWSRRANQEPEATTDLPMRVELLPIFFPDQLFLIYQDPPQVPPPPGSPPLGL